MQADVGSSTTSESAAAQVVTPTPTSPPPSPNAANLQSTIAASKDVDDDDDDSDDGFGMFRRSGSHSPIIQGPTDLDPSVEVSSPSFLAQELRPTVGSSLPPATDPIPMSGNNVEEIEVVAGLLNSKV